MTSFDNSKPIYLQIAEHIKTVLSSGELAPGSRIPPVRELAAEFGVTPNTVQKALHELEHGGYVYTERTSGRFVTKDHALLEQLRAKNKEMVIKKFISDMAAVGVDKEELPALIKKYNSASHL